MRTRQVQPNWIIIAGLLMLGSVGCGGTNSSEFVEFHQLPSQPGSTPAPEADQPQTPTEPPTDSPSDTTPDIAAAQPETTTVTEQPGVTPESSASPAPDQTADQTVIVATEASASQPAPETPDAGPPTVSGPLEIKLLIPEKVFRPEKNTTALRVSYDDIDLLKVLNMEPVPVDAIEYFPEWLKSLDGATIRIRGFMYPTFEATGLTGFTLARDNGICCFVRQPKIYDIIAVELAPGVTSDYIEGKPFDVEGTFRIQPESDETDLFRLYRIENARVLR